MSEEKYWCVRCYQLQEQPAGENCGNPEWHAAPRPEPPVDEPEPDEA